MVLDTNVISEPFRPHPDSGVLDWIAGQQQVAISAVSVGELLRGVSRLPAGRRRDYLTGSIEATLAAYADDVLAYGAEAARAYAGIHELRRSMRRPLAIEDGMIAATALVHGATLATRNVDDFADVGLVVVNPWMP